MVTSLSRQGRVIIVATFALAVFGAAGYGSYRAGQVKADEAVTTTFTEFTTPSATPKPFYQDGRYLLLITDAVLVLGLSFTLTVRLLSRFLATTNSNTPSTTNSSGIATIDDLNMDIPL